VAGVERASLLSRPSLSPSWMFEKPRFSNLD